MSIVCGSPRLLALTTWVVRGHISSDVYRIEGPGEPDQPDLEMVWRAVHNEHVLHKSDICGGRYSLWHTMMTAIAGSVVLSLTHN